jgi:hypothetical protein
MECFQFKIVCGYRDNLSYLKLRQRSQANVIGFLSTDLDFGATDARNDSGHAEARNIAHNF